jgi:hypothetical protein
VEVVASWLVVEVAAAATAFSVDSSATTATVAWVVAATGASLVGTGVEDDVEAASSPTAVVVSTGAGVSTTATGDEVEVISGAAEVVEVRYTVL